MIGCGKINRFGMVPPAGWARDVVPAAQELHQLVVLLPREVGPDAHVRRDILVVGERPFRRARALWHWLQYMAKTSPPVSESSKLSARLAGARNAQGGGALRKVDRRVLTTDVASTATPTSGKRNRCHRSEKMDDTSFPSSRLRVNRFLFSQLPPSASFQKLVANCIKRHCRAISMKLGIDLVGDLEDR